MSSVKVEWGESYECVYCREFETLDKAKDWVNEFFEGLDAKQGWKYGRDGHWYEVYLRVEIEQKETPTLHEFQQMIIDAAEAYYSGGGK
jgi:hypothetical protein